MIRKELIDIATAKKKPDKLGELKILPIAELHPFPDHPFSVKDDDAMTEMVESVKQFGVLEPGICRPRKDGGYEIIAGHRRTHACEKAEVKEMPFVVRDLDDDEAVIMLVDSNIQREDIPPSEKAKAYKMKMEALKHQGKRHDLTSAQVEQKLGWAVNQVAEDVGQSRAQVQRYIRLNNLNPELKEMVDEGRLAFTPAVELSYLSPEEQRDLAVSLEETQNTPSLSQAQQIKKLSQEKRCTKEALHALLAVASIKERNVVIKHEVIMQYFPAEASDAEIESLIVRLLADYRKTHGGV